MGRHLTLALAALAIAFRAVETEGEDRKIMPELYFQITKDVATPHIAWAKPYWGGAVKALVIAPRWTHRETVELMERMDVECVPVLLRSETEVYLEGWDWGLENERRAKKDWVLNDINKALEKDYDVIIMGKVPLKKMPEDILAKIEAKVKNGCGLVYIHNKLSDADFEKKISQNKVDGERERVEDGFAFEQYPGFKVRGDKNRQKDMERLLTLYRHGDGNVAFINYPDRSNNLFLTPPDMSDLNYEYYQAFAVKALLWASRKSAPLLFKEFGVDGEGKVLTAKVSKAGPFDGTDLTLTLSIRTAKKLFRSPAASVIVPGVHQTASMLNPVYQNSVKVSLAEDAGEARMSIPELPHGDYVADAILVSGGKNINWAAAAFTTKNVQRISGITCEPDVIDCKEPGVQQIRCVAKYGAELPDEASLQVSLFDNYDRVLSEKIVSVPKGSSSSEATLDVKKEAIISSLLLVRAELRSKDGKAVSVETAPLTTVRRSFPGFTFFAWGGGSNDYVARQTLRLNASTGIVDAYRAAGDVEKLKVADMRFVPDIVRFFATTKDKAVMSSPTPFWGDREYRRELYKTVRRSIENGRKFDTFAHLLGDEMSLLNQPAEICAGNVQDFRKYLMGVYKTIAELNKEWNTNYSTFDEINPITRKEAGEKAAKDKNFAPLIDLWMFNYWTFADTVRFVKDVKNEIDPSSRIGASTPLWNWWWRGYYWDEIMPHLDYFTPYYKSVEGQDDTAVEGGISFAKPGTTFSGHTGSYIVDLPQQEYYTVVPHAYLLKGCGNFFWYFLHTGTEGCMSPSLDYYPQTMNTIGEVRKIKAGLGQLILGAEKDNRQIAVLYSTPSYLYSFLASQPHLPWNYNSAIVSLHRLGFQADTLSPKQIADGKLKGYKAVFLPVSVCLDTKTAEKIREFVKDGGLAIADVRPGIADEHGRLHEKSLLADVFGMHWDNPLDNPVQTIEMLPNNKKAEQSLEFAFNGMVGSRNFSGPPVKDLGFDTAAVVDDAQPAIRFSFTQQHLDKLRKVLDDDVKLDKNSKDKLNDKAKAELENRIKKIEAVKRELFFVTREKYGKGMAVCLNSPFTANPVGSNVMGAIFSEAGVAPPIQVVKGNQDFAPGQWIPDFGFDKFKDGQAMYFGMVKFKKKEFDDEGSDTYYGVVKTQGGAQGGREKEYEVSVDFKRSGHLYEPLTGKYHGVQSSVKNSFGAWEAKWYSLLPYKVEAVKAVLKGGNVKPGEPIKGVVSLVVPAGSALQRHVINLKVTDKNKTPIQYLSQNLETKNGEAEFAVPTALNDAAREWTLVFTDAATGVGGNLVLGGAR